MFKGLMNGFSKTWLIVIFCVILVIGLYFHSMKKNRYMDMMTTGYDTGVIDHEPELNYPTESYPIENYEVQEEMSDPNDLLPKDSNSQWASLNPIAQGNVAIPDLLQSGYHIGLDSIGQSLKNANYQDRADPIIAMKPTGIWNQSTIEPDLARVSM